MIVPYAVYNEVTLENKPFSNILKNFLHGKIKRVNNKVAVDILKSDLGYGESELIVLAIEEEIKYILLDDLKARKIAKLRGLEVVGTMGVLLKGKQKGHIKKIKPLIDELIKNNIRIGENVTKITLQAAKG